MRMVQIVGLTFALGALTAATLVWRLDSADIAPSPISATEAEIAALEASSRPSSAPPTHTPPAEPHGAQRPRTPSPVGTTGDAAHARAERRSGFAADRVI